MPFKIEPFGGARYNGHYADNQDFKQYFGLKPQDKWPTGAMSDVYVKTTKGAVTSMWLLPRAEPVMKTRWDRLAGRFIEVPVKTSKHRCYVLCPDCSRGVPAGRAHQHKCGGKGSY